LKEAETCSGGQRKLTWKSASWHECWVVQTNETIVL